MRSIHSTRLQVSLSVVATCALALASTACLPSFTTMQRPSTLPRGEIAVGVAVGGLVTAAPEDPAKPEKQTQAIAPHAEVAMRYGLLERVDVGGRLGLLGLPLTFDAKLQVYRGDTLQLAVAPGFGMSLLQLLDTDSKGGGVLHFYLPLIAGIRFGEHWLLLGAKYVGAYLELTLSGKLSQAYVHLPGAMLGADIAIGASTHFLPELDAHCVVAQERLCFVVGSLGVMF